MSRNISNEILAAVSVVVVIAFAVAFGVLLSSSLGDDRNPTEVSAQSTPVVSESNIEDNNLLEQTQERVITETRSPAETLSPTILDDSNLTPTVTQTQSFTPMFTVVPTQTSTSTVTATLTSTRTPFPVETSGILPTPTITFAPTLPAGRVAIASITPAACIPPDGWRSYIVQPGNTLFSIARAVGSSVTMLRVANCLQDVNRITVGDVLSVPRLPVGSFQTISTPDSLSSDFISARSIGCLNPGVRILSPAAGMRVSGVLTISGSALWPQFGYYKLEVRLNDASTYNFIARFDTPVQSGQLGTIDTDLFNSGLHWIRLALVDSTGNIPDGATCVIPVVFE